MSQRELPVRASLENLRKQAKALHRAFRDGDADAIQRIRQHLPKAAALSDEDLSRLDLSLQETQHVLAKEYGHGSWEDLRSAVETPFATVADLPKDAVQALLRVSDRQDWVVAIAVPHVAERVRESILACMSRRVAQEIMAAQAAAPPSPVAVGDAQARILTQVRRLADEGTLTWPPESPLGSFEDLARLNDRETQVLMREVSQLDLTRALIGAPEAVRGRVLGNMSRRVRTALVEEGERLAPELPAHEPDASCQRILEWAFSLGRDRRIGWPPPADRESWSGSMEELLAELRDEGPTRDRPEDPLGGLGLEDLSIDDLARIYGELTTKAQREGILSLEEIANAQGPLSEGLRLAVDGTDGHIVERMLGTRADTVVRNRRLRLQMMRDGVLALQAGTNPRLIWHQMQAHYLDPGQWEPSRRLNEAITGAEVRDWIEREWLGTTSPAEIAELFLHLGHAARNEGIQVLQGAAEALEQPLLKEALTRAVEERDDPTALQSWMRERIDAEVLGLEARLRAVTAGVLGVMAGHDADQVGDEVRATAAARGPATAGPTRAMPPHP